MKNLFVFLGIVIFTSCSRNQNQVQTEVWKQEIREAERAFDSLSQAAGIQQAFVTFAAKDVTVLRNNNLIHGKSALKDYFISNTKAENVSLTWKPDFVDVSSSGDLGYTYGKYVYTATDSVGNTQTSEGFFHTVWKRQPDGTWKFVWD